MYRSIKMKLSQILFLTVGFLMMSKSVYATEKSIEFHTRNYTINCASDGPNGVGCAIKGDFIKHKYKPTQPCELDWGQNFSLASKNKAELDCSSDTYGGSENSQLLKAGQTIKGDGWSCTALKNDGIKCLNTSKKNGFILQKHRQILINNK